MSSLNQATIKLDTKPSQKSSEILTEEQNMLYTIRGIIEIITIFVKY